MIAEKIAEWAKLEGFRTFHDVRTRLSIADLVKKADRCGLYCLAFQNEEAYIGLSVDIAKRFGQHRLYHTDIAAIAVKPFAKPGLDSEETRLIGSAERGGLLLRNFSKASFVRGETDFDLLVPPPAQQAWLHGTNAGFDTSFRVNDEALRRKKRRQAALVLSHPPGMVVIKLFRQFIFQCIPEPLRTESAYWSVSLTPATNAGAIWRINVNWQEVGILLHFEEGFTACFQVRKSLLDTSAIADALPEVELAEFAYRPGGADQIRVCIDDDHSGSKIGRLLEMAAFQCAMKPLVLDLMRKGPNNFASSHCFQLVDAALVAIAEPVHT